MLWPQPQPVVVEEKAPVTAVTAEAVPLPEVKKSEDVRYRIKWGDTLWDISNTYYRTPWLYKKIARDNKIKNPDLIYAGYHIIIKSE